MDYRKWIEDIVVEVAEISVMKAAFLKTKDIISSNSSSIYLINLSYRNFYYAHFTSSKRQLIWQTSDDTLLKVQELSNKYLNIISGNVIKDWNILLNNKIFTDAPITSIRYNIAI